MNGSHAALNLASQISSAQVDVEEGRLGTFVTSKQGNFVDIPSTPGKVCQAKVSKGVRRELVNASAFGDPFDDL